MSAALRYRVEVLDPHAHLFTVTLNIDRPMARQRVSLPAWIPGSYLVREFAQHLQNLRADCDNQHTPLKQLDKHSWEVAPGKNCKVLTLRYEVYAFDASVRTAYLDQTRGFFNPTSMCLRVHGREDEAHALEVVSNEHTSGWQLATGLAAAKAKRNGFGHYLAANYDELADCPVEMGLFWSGSFKVRGVLHRFVVSGAGPWFDSDRLLRDTQAICEAEIAFWHGDKGKPPFTNYLFMLHASAGGYGGLEHRNSTALICQRSDLPRLPSSGQTEPAKLKATDGYTTLLGLISHEYFHTWNVKRLRPKEFTRYDYTQENYTQLLWFFEGFTSYYDDLLVRNAGLIDDATHLQLLTKSINHVLQTPGRHVQSVAQASFDAWIKYYRVQENTPNATVSYYTKGALVALCLDLTLRAEGHTTLDDVMRSLWQRCDAGPMTEADLLAELKRLGKRSYAIELNAWVHGTGELPLRSLLEKHNVQWLEEPAPLAQQLGLRVSESNGLILKNVLRGSPAEAAGMAANDEWLGVELKDAEGTVTHAWRVNRLDDVALYAHGQDTVTALLARDGRLLRCQLRWPTVSHTVRLVRRSAGTPSSTGQSHQSPED